MVMSGNSGNPNPGTGQSWTSGSAEGKRLLVNLTASSIRVIKTGNSWGTGGGNDWFIVIGSNNPAATDWSGDFVGSGALDLLGSYAAGAPSTVIINPGTYTFTSNTSDYRNINFVGISNSGTLTTTASGTRPLINLNGGTGYLDHAGQRSFKLGRKISGLTFSSVGANINSIDVGPVTTTTGTTEVEDCYFLNTTLTADRSTTPANYRIYVRDCVFEQNDSFSDRFSCVLPSARVVKVENCTFLGNGYALGIGDNGSGYINTALTATNNIEVTNCTMDMTGFSIDNSPPDGTEDNHSYFYINVPKGNILVDHCRVVANNALSPSATPINAILLNTTNEVVDFVNLSGLDISVTNSLFNGPNQLFDTDVNSNPLPTVFCEPRASLRWDGNRVVGGALPLQISGSAALSETSLRSGIHISNSEFIQSGFTHTNSVCLLDIDLDLTFTNVSDGLPSVTLSNNVFRQKIQSAPRKPLHANLVGGDYSVLGVVQIYAAGLTVNANNNKITGSIIELAGVTNYGGLAINNFDATSAVAEGAIHSRINVSNNDIKIFNIDAEDVSAAFIVSSLWTKGSVLNICNNYINMDNAAVAVSGSFAGCMYLFAAPSTGASYSDAIVTGNICSRVNEEGSTNPLKRAYIYIPTSSGRGMFTNNSFSHATIDGTLTTVIEDGASVANKWIKTQNKNQTDILNVRGSMGLHTRDFYVTNTPGTSIITVEDDIITSKLAVYDYKDDPSEVNFIWQLSCRNILPEYATIVSVAVYFVTNVIPATTNEITIIIEDDSTSEVSSIDNYALTTSLLTFTPTLTFVNNPSNSPLITINSNVQHPSGITSLKTERVLITYRW